MSSEVRFTRAQKWDLVRISAAAIASTVFFTVPLFLIRPQPPEKSEARDIVRAAGVDAKPASDPTLAASAVHAETNTVSVVTSTEFARATRPALQKTVTAARTTKPAPRLRARASTSGAAPSLSRRVVRFIAGSGKYSVKPFPTVGTAGTPEN